MIIFFNFYDTRFQTCNDLIIYLSDVLRRLRNTWHTNYRILGKSAKEREFVRYTNTPEFADDLKKEAKYMKEKNIYRVKQEGEIVTLNQTEVITITKIIASNSIFFIL